MTSPVETTAAMTPSAEQRDPAPSPAAAVAAALADPASVPVASVPAGAADIGGPAAGRRELSLSFVIALFGGLLTTLLGALIGLMMWQFDSLGARIDGLDARIDSLGTELRAEMDELETEMRLGFAEINTVLLDHTDRLARLETAAGLPRIEK